MLVETAPVVILDFATQTVHSSQSSEEECRWQIQKTKIA
jgi:hypothetical protein